MYYIQADVYINTVGTDLDLGNGAVSRSFLQAGGQALQNECKSHVSQHGNVPVGNIVVTKPGAIPCHSIIHTVGTKYDGKHSEVVSYSILVVEVIFIINTYVGIERYCPEVFDEV